jgi:hypothetical protein
MRCRPGAGAANGAPGPTRISRARAYAAIEGPTRVRDIMPERSSWTGNAADLLRIGADRSCPGISRDRMGWLKNPRALAGRLRRAQTFLRTLGIEITFSREGRSGNRVIRMRATSENTVSTVGSVSDR